MDKELMASEAQSLYMDLKKMSPTVKDKWEEIGHKLGLSRETLKAISQKYPMQRFFAMLNDWLSRKGDCVYHSVTLRALVHAFQSKEVDESKLAAEIMKTRGKKPYNKPSVPKTNVKSDEASVKSKRISSLPEPKLEKYLRKYYLIRGSQHQKDEWPPSFNVKYINLVMIQQSAMPWNKSKAKRNIGLIAKGQMESIQGARLCSRDIMTSNGRLCIINGAPGVGKTTLALKLRRDWADRKLLFKFHLVLYIPLREPFARLSETVDELLKHFDENCNADDKELIKKEHGKGVLFILDGWDELKLSCRGESQFFPRLISGSILPGCSIIVTSRPGASQDICCYADQIIEILGFGREQVEEYIEAYFANACDGDGASHLITDLLKYPNIASTCYVAINLAIVCHVYQALSYRLPQTLTEIYKWFIIHTILRYLKKKKVAEKMDEQLPAVESTEDVFASPKFDQAVQDIFKESVMDTLKNLGYLALSGLQHDDLCFCRKDLVSTCNLDVNDHQFDGLGLLKPVQISHLVGSEPYYHFLHLSIQEFVAAYHLSQMQPSEQMRWLVHDSKYDNTIKFFCGVNQFKSQPLRIFFKNAEPLRLFHLECVYEGQWKDHCKVIANRCSSSFTLSENNTFKLQPQQWAVLGYVMSNSETQWHFTCQKQILDEKCLTCFTEHLSNKSLHHLTLEEVDVDHGAVMHLSEICQLQEGLTKLDIINCVFSNEDILTFLKAMEYHKCLEKLCIRDRLVAAAVVSAFWKLLPTLSKLKEIELDIKSFSCQDYLDIKQFAFHLNPPPNVIVPDKLFPEQDQLKGKDQLKTCRSESGFSEEDVYEIPVLAPSVSSVKVDSTEHTGIELPPVKVDIKTDSGSQDFRGRVIYLCENDIPDVLRSVLDILDRWHDLGLALGLKIPELNVIEKDKSTSRDCMKAVLLAWLQGRGRQNPTWQTLCKALRDELVGRADLAKLVEGKIFGQTSLKYPSACN